MVRFVIIANMQNKKPCIVVFAGNSCKKERESYYYQMAYQTGKLLAQAGFVVATGGGPGLMREVMRGAYEHGGKTIGVCLNMGKSPYGMYAKTIYRFQYLEPRQKKLLSLGDGFISLAGGIGTLYEIFQVLALKRKGDMSMSIPLALLNGQYDDVHRLLEKIAEEGFIAQELQQLYHVVQTPEDAVTMMKETLL